MKKKLLKKYISQNLYFLYRNQLNFFDYIQEIIDKRIKTKKFRVKKRENQEPFQAQFKKSNFFQILGF